MPKAFNNMVIPPCALQEDRNYIIANAFEQSYSKFLMESFYNELTLLISKIDVQFC